MKKLAEIQAKLKAPKGQKNSFGNYYYRSCEDILEAVKPMLGDSVLTLEDEIVMVGTRYYVKATATFFTNGVVVRSVSAYAREEENKKGMDAAQITGACSSYARKYALNGLFLIDDTKDSDTNEVSKLETKKEKQLPVLKSDSQDFTKICNYLIEKGIENLPKVLEKYQVLEPVEIKIREYVELANTNKDEHKQ